MTIVVNLIGHVFNSIVIDLKMDEKTLLQYFALSNIEKGIKFFIIIKRNRIFHLYYLRVFLFKVYLFTLTETRMGFFSGFYGFKIISLILSRTNLFGWVLLCSGTAVRILNPSSMGTLKQSCICCFIVSILYC